ncbi:MAG TPA: dienelactone hydrolase family protein [Moraxellaceae bacterium]|nr:dienelactone hydrolase family protein [Moraxellaceae bacterium]
MRRWFRTCLIGLSLCLSLPAFAAIQTREIPYKAPDGTSLIGYYAYDDSVKGARPGVIVVHEWWGLNDYARRRARELAGLGYAALAIDMFGDGKHTEHAHDAKAWMESATSDAAVSMARAQAGLDLLKAQPEVDAKKLAAIGYCFGGKIVLDMARTGMDLAGVVSFHGVLATATPAEKGKVHARVLVLNGADDSFIPADAVAAFKKEMDDAKVDYRFVNYAGAHHAFTSPDADRLAKDNNLDLAYNAKADKASWKEMRKFFQQIFNEHPYLRMMGY